MTEASVQQFDQRISGTEQFQSEDGVQAIRARRALWLRKNDRWTRYSSTRVRYSKTAYSILRLRIAVFLATSP